MSALKINKLATSRKVVTSDDTSETTRAIEILCGEGKMWMDPPRARD